MVGMNGVRLTRDAAALIALAVIATGCGGGSGSGRSVRRTRTALCVAVDQAGAHASPSADSEVVAELMIASNVWADSVAGEWWRIEHEDGHAWLHHSLVDTGHLPQAIVVQRQAGALEGVLQRRASEQESELEEIRRNALGGE